MISIQWYTYSPIYLGILVIFWNFAKFNSNCFYTSPEVFYIDNYNQRLEMALSFISWTGCFLFDFITSLDWLGHATEVMKKDILPFSTTLGRKHSIFHLLRVNCRSFTDVLKLSNFPSVLNLLSFDKWMLNFSNAFSASVEMNMWLVFSLLI